MDIKKIRSFRTFIESGCNYKRSATLCAVTIPGLRKQLFSLEEELGAKLFYTEGKITHPTREAQTLYDKTHRLINDYTDIVHYFDTAIDSIEKPLLVGTTMAVASLWVCDYFKNFIEEYPDSHITVQGSDKQPDLIKDNFDIYIGPKLPDEKRLLNQHHIETYNMRLYASEDYLTANGSPHSVEDLQFHKIIGFGSDIGLGSNATTPFNKVNWHLQLTDPALKTSFNINTGGGLLRAIELGYGIGIISNIGAQVTQTKLVNVLPNVKGHDIPIYFCYPKFLKSDIRVIKLLESLKKSIKDKLSA